jgi:porphobilinogen deaminase
MRVSELIKKLQQYAPDTEVVIMTSHDGGDDVQDHDITEVHDEWNRKVEHDLVSIECDITE